jgi:hypothetical protein
MTADKISWRTVIAESAAAKAQERRQAHHAKDAHWLTVEQALKIEGTTDPTRLRMELKQGLPCRFRHRGRWWQWSPLEEVAPLLDGRNPLDLQDDRWELVVHEKYWRERLGKSGAPAPTTGTGVQRRDATDDEIRVAMRAVYDEKGDERPNTKKIVSPVRNRLKSEGLYASRERIGDIAGEEEFKKRRNPPGPTKRSRQSK